MSKVNASSEPRAGKRVLLPLLRRYYLFDYFKHLGPRLREEGFDVEVVTFDPKLAEEYGKLKPELKVRQGPRLIRSLNNRSGKVMYRLLLWMAAWIWALWLKRKVDFVIVPFDQKPIWYAMTRVLTSMTCHTSTDMVDFEIIAEHLEAAPEVQSRFSHRLLMAVDHLSGGRLMMRAGCHIMQYYPSLLLVDRLMGYRATCSLQGFSGANYITVEGEQVRQNYLALGVGGAGSRTQLAVVGSPAYEKVFEIAANFGTADRARFRASFGIPENRPILSFFLSPSVFSEVQIEEIAEAVDVTRSQFADPFFIIKLHPKTRPGEPERIRNRLKLGDADLLMITEFGGDEFNMRLVLVSSCLVQKQSTVGFIAMLLGVPIVSYDLRDTGYNDDLYKALGASFHAESTAELIAAFELLKTEHGAAELKRRQEEACRKFCIRTPSPCGLIVEVIRRHFSSQSEKKHGNRSF